MSFTNLIVLEVTIARVVLPYNSHLDHHFTHCMKEFIMFKIAEITTCYGLIIILYSAL